MIPISLFYNSVGWVQKLHPTIASVIRAILRFHNQSSKTIKELLLIDDHIFVLGGGRGGEEEIN